MRERYPVSPVEWVWSLLFPPRCLLCGQVVAPGRLFCPACALGLPEEPLCRRLALPQGGELAVRSPLAYEGGFRDTLHDFKFHGQRALARPIAWLMAGAAEGCGPFDGVAFAPMHEDDRRSRGYDQSQLLARHLAKALGLPLLCALEKTRHTQAQHGLDRAARLENPRNAYRACMELSGKSLLLVDDIVTTGSTLVECAQNLYQAGARAVCGICAGDTPA